MNEVESFCFCSNRNGSTCVHAKLPKINNILKRFIEKIIAKKTKKAQISLKISNNTSIINNILNFGSEIYIYRALNHI